MDEPTTALDVVTQREILEELMDLRERLGFAVLFITHDLSLLIEIADTIAVMYAGRLVESVAREPTGRPASVLIRAAELVPQAARCAAGHERHPWVAPDLRQLPSGCVFHPRCKYVMERCQTESPPLVSPATVSPGSPPRLVSCWLHADEASEAAAPAELAVPDDLAMAGAAAAPAMASPTLASPTTGNTN